MSNKIGFIFFGGTIYAVMRLSPPHPETVSAPLRGTTTTSAPQCGASKCCKCVKHFKVYDEIGCQNSL